MSEPGKQQEKKDPSKEKKKKGWKNIDLSEPPSGPLMRSVTSMNGMEEPEWPLDEDDDAGMEDEGDLKD